MVLAGLVSSASDLTQPNPANDDNRKGGRREKHSRAAAAIEARREGELAEPSMNNSNSKP